MVSLVSRSRIRFVACCAVLAGLVTAPAYAKSPPSAGKSAVRQDVVELFAGIKSGDLKVRVVTTNEFESKVWITNTTAKPLTVQLPKSAAAVHVLKQNLPGGLFQGNNGNGNQNGNQNGNGQGQSVGGNFGNQGNQNGNQIGNNQGLNFLNGLNPQNGNNGFFSIPSKRYIQVPLHTVCLEHGKPTPMVRMTYELRPLDAVVTDPVLQRVLTEYDAKKDDRMAMQAAAWHLADGLSWEKLQTKVRRRLGGLGAQRYFSRNQLKSALQLVETAKKADKRDDGTAVRLSSRSAR